MSTHEERTILARQREQERQVRGQEKFVTMVTEGIIQKAPVSGTRVRMDIYNRVQALQDEGFRKALATAKAYIERTTIPSREAVFSVFGAMEFYIKELSRATMRTPHRIDTFCLHTSYLDRDYESPLMQARQEIAASIANDSPETSRALLDNTQMATLHDWVKEGKLTLSPRSNQALQACVALEHVRSTIEDYWPHLDGRRFDTRGI